MNDLHRRSDRFRRGSHHRAQERSRRPRFALVSPNKVFDFEGADFDFDLRVDFLDVDGSVRILQDGGQQQISARLILAVDLEHGFRKRTLRPKRQMRLSTCATNQKRKAESKKCADRCYYLLSNHDEALAYFYPFRQSDWSSTRIPRWKDVRSDSRWFLWDWQSRRWNRRSTWRSRRWRSSSPPAIEERKLVRTLDLGK